MPSLATIRTTLADIIDAAVPDLHRYETVPETVNLPCFVIKPASTDFAGAFGRGMDTYVFDVIVLTSRRDDELAQYDLDEYINGFGSKSIRQAIWNARTSLAAIGIDAHVTGMSDYGARFDIGQEDHVGARLRVQVMTDGTA